MADDETSRHPCFIMYLAVPHLRIGVCVLTDRSTFSVLPLNFHWSNEEAFSILARHLLALKNALESLRSRYLSVLQVQVSNRQMLHRTPAPVYHIFPYSISFTLSNFSDEECAAALLFTSKTNSHFGDICIKFLRRYGKEAHLWCTAQGFAPNLIAFETLLGSLFMVVMELLHESWVELPADTKMLQGLPAKIKSAVSNLHQQKMVHGDLRYENVMVKNDKLGFHDC
ncbi:hypothetical protein AX17_004697 [Amanita inopinata Kibby_2008]|nr:hypothetical protein AX17_004697 [Amanita inopinata Kibby_2008]